MVFPPAKAESILAQLLLDDQLAVYAQLLQAAEKNGLRLAIGGGLALSAYSGYMRNTKDMDLYVVEPDQKKLIKLMIEQGFAEYNAVEYDPTWSYRGSRRGFIVDLLWKMLNGRGAVDEVWTSRGWALTVRGVALRLIPPEELAWSKLYILRRERADWPDILNLIFAQGPEMDWERLLARVGEDRPVLTSLMSLFCWMCPGRAADLPEFIWKRLGMELRPPAHDGPLIDRTRTTLFKANDWFTTEVW
ncbi:nucleotidyltransferase family protein [Geotalea toluenoxydans]|uniref:nucleotidyltransferase family protein n=1 Tax=Geotalea toluenoxydans TaxID=421624 RepID=UPI0006D0581E|nr:nucleotidyltransferase family protein [Geotalea toluenoxydans]